ncbi:MAG: ABC transporter permease [Fimbriimonadaceae bacterium]|nr:ABC transporter permease [Fimbriimonadaceae bacterium]QYK58845.1 MAG: ABC transporter permease [Fimbriimonadaceae bacterium]
MRENLRELWRYRELLFAMVEREIRIRYKNSVLGFFWSLINPLVTMLVLWLVFKFFLRNSTENFTPNVLAAYLPFMFVQLAVLDSSQSVLVSLQVVKKVYFPREILPLAGVIANFVHYLLALVVFFLYMFVVWASTGFQDSPFTWRIAFLPILLIVTVSLTTGLALIVSALNVFYEDVKYAISILLYLLFFLTPVMYFSENVYYSIKNAGLPPVLYDIYHLNPLATLATTYKKVLVPPGPVDAGGGLGLVQPLPMNWGLFGVTFLVSVGLLAGGYALFNRLKWRFVERP